MAEYSLRKDGNTYLSEHFRVAEFACNDGSDKILIDDELVNVLERLRKHFNAPIYISSGYRTEAYNKRIGGASKSQHVYGKAADIRVTGVNPKEVALYAQEINTAGIGLYSYVSGGFVHVDVRKGKWRGVQVNKNGGSQSVTNYFPTLRKGSSGNCVVLVQRAVGVRADGQFGALTHDAVKGFQKKHGLAVDGVVGKKTWSIICKG